MKHSQLIFTKSMTTGMVYVTLVAPQRVHNNGSKDMNMIISHIKKESPILSHPQAESIYQHTASPQSILN